MRLTYVDHQTLSRLAKRQAYRSTASANPRLESLRNEVRRAVDLLKPEQSEIIAMYYFEEKTIAEIKRETGLAEKQIWSLIRAGKTALRYALADSVKAYWPGKFRKSSKCPICRHPRREAIEMMILSKSDTDNWKTLNLRLEKTIGISFHPPIIMQYHMKFHHRS